ncbi:mutS protein homolog 5-like isoform X2 [Corticium candelabrum]|nr:mutS protein homolog 5-like isoform X2 [Corticium candelabrum]
MPAHFTDKERSIYSTSLLPMDSANTIRCLGALCKYLDKHRVNVELETSDVRVPILAVKTFSLDDVMIIDDNTLSALQVFLKEYHPSAYKASSTREGLSLFGICNRTRTTIGSRRLKLWFLQPLRDITVLQKRINAVEFLTSTRHVDVVQSLVDCLRHVKNVPRILSRMTSAHASVGDWQSLYKTVCNAIYIGDACRALPKEIDIFCKIAATFSDDLHRIANLINKIVDFEESKSQNKFVVKTGVDEELDRKKQTYNNLPDLMTDVAREELDKFGSEIEECAVVYLPQLGYLLAVPCTAHMKEAQDFELDGLEFVFWNDNTAHYKSHKTKELDARLGDTQCEITDQETAIMHKLQSVILEHCAVLLAVMEHAAELDCLISFALTAKECNYIKPTLNEDNVFNIKGSRHPLQELCVNPFIPNDIVFDGINGRMKILTGPNASGKSVYIKQVALIVYMAHIGSFIPAESAIISITDRIFSRVHTRESVSVNLSTFMIDLNQVSMALRCCTQQSLIIVDEFGKGTSNVDGLALLSSSLRYWLRMDTQCPKLIVSTHFHSLIQQQLLPDSPQLQYQTMEVMHDKDELVFLYQLKDGHTSSSYASHIAAVANIPAELIARAQEVTELFRQGRPIHRIDSASTETRSKKYAAIVSQFLDLDLSKDDVVGFLNHFVLPTADSMEDSYR